MEANELVQLLLRQNQLTSRLTNQANDKRGVSEFTKKEHRWATHLLMAEMLGRDPTADELDTVCNW